MTIIPFTYEDYIYTREQLVKSITEKLTEKDKKFIAGFEQGEPDWNLFPIQVLKDLPAVNWKLLNIERFKKENPKKHLQMVENLKAMLGL
jgi:DNA-binding transcriptional MocR family regulator